MHQAIQHMVPQEAWAALEAGATEKGENMICAAMEKNTGLRWAITQGVWSFGAASISEFILETKKYTIKDVIDKIQCPCLVIDAEGDMFFKGQPHEVYDGLRAPKKLFEFTSEDGAENHCQSGALAHKDQVVFNWVDETLKSRNGHKA